MAFAQADLCQVAILGRVRQLWSYVTTDAAATVAASGYFTGTAVNMLRVGDLIIRETLSALPIVETTTTVTTWGIHVVLSNDGTTVDLSDALVGIVANAG